MKYTCNRCNKIFLKKYNYTKHINRKNPCDNNILEINNIEIPLQDNVDITPKINNNKCPYCYKIFFQKSNVLIHINNKSCKILKDKNTINENDKIIEKLNELLQQNKKIQEDQQKIEELTKLNNINNKNKQTIPKTLKKLVWDTYIGANKGIAKCICCNHQDIRQIDFHCGHNIAEINGGETNINNLRPICSQCNQSMGSISINEFKNKYFN
jgi:uncharacterized C2H2 Zn-finger protein